MRAALRSNPGSNVFRTGRIGELRRGRQRQADGREVRQGTRPEDAGDAARRGGPQDAGVQHPGQQAKEIWRFASAEYARQSSDQAWVVQGNCVRDRNTWNTRQPPSRRRAARRSASGRFHAEHLAFEELIWHASGWKSKCKDWCTCVTRPASRVVYDARDINGPEDPDYGGSWTDLNRGNRNHWLDSMAGRTSVASRFMAPGALASVRTPRDTGIVRTGLQRAEEPRLHRGPH